MKKLTFTIILSVFIGLGFSSCKKCIECKGKNATGGDVKEEYCGSKQSREDFEKSFGATYTDVKCDD